MARPGSWPTLCNQTNISDALTIIAVFLTRSATMLLEDARARKLDCVLVWKLDRFGRFAVAYDHGYTGNRASPNYLGILRSQNLSSPSGGHNNVNAGVLLYIFKLDEVDALHVVQNFIKPK